MSPKQWIVLGIAAAAAGGALVLVRAAGEGAPAAAAVKAPLGPMVLVAAKDIPLGAEVTPEHLVWSEWPKGSLNPGFIQQATRPTAKDDLLGAIARVDVRQGEPIFDGRLVQRGDGGVLSAILTPGFRAVALPVSPATASAGFIQPNDRVDVVLTRTIERQTADGTVSEPRSGVILVNIRVLAMGEHVRQSDDGADPPAPIDASVATLELSPRDAEILMTAVKLGEVSLALRGIESASRSGAPSADPFPSDVTLQSAVRVHAFGAAAEHSVPRVLQ